MASALGTLFRISTWGESHGGGVGVVIDGCPPKLPISLEEVQSDLDRRRPGQSSLVTQRKESDRVQVLSGIQDGLALGTPIMMMVPNEDQRSGDYDEMREKYRPSHADYTYDAKYGIRAIAGGGRSSARETVGRVAAGSVAKQFLRAAYGLEVIAYVESVRDIRADIDPMSVSRAAVEANAIRCPNAQKAEEMVALIEEIRKGGNSVGGTIGCIATPVPAGLGEPVFDKLEADLAKAVMSLPACKGFEVGSGFAGTLMTGMEHNDAFRAENGSVFTTTNHSGGIQGGISNGMPIQIRAAFKPTATVMREQPTITREMENTTLTGRGRHDPCVLPRAVVMVESMVALVLADHALRQNAITFNFS